MNMTIELNANTFEECLKIDQKRVIECKDEIATAFLTLLDRIEPNTHMLDVRVRVFRIKEEEVIKDSVIDYESLKEIP